MGTLYECLREARLEKYYPTLRFNGITKSESLAKLTPDDCAAIGVTSTEDKRRLIELINIIKSVHSSEPTASGFTPPRGPHSGARQPARKRNRSPAYGIEVAGRALSATSDVRVRENRPLNHNHLSRAEIFDLLSSSGDSSSESEHSDYEPAKKQLGAAAASPPRSRKTAVSRVKQSGYNYGVPKAAGLSVNKSRSRPSEGQRDRPTGEEKIKVCVRKRPLNKRELKNGEEDIAVTESTTTLTVNEPKLAVDLTAYTLQHEFIFDEVFDQACSNEDVYIRAARPLVNCIFTGGSATCFAYGQTGAGKTHTMMGSREVPGLYLLASHDIFSVIDSKQYGSDLKVWVSFFEIYCGQLFDLLNKRNRLQAREDGSHRVCIAGLTETEVKDVQAIMQVLEYGNSVRSKGATGVNPDSSRSHAVLQLEIRNAQDKRVGRMSFIDLAGSERASDMTDTDRQTRMEGAEINQSLLALKECIRSIDQDSKHTPFRQSKLTHILKDSFVGNSRTCMIANISPNHSSCEHTLNTLRYADRVKELRRDAAPPGSRGSMASHILMNIPPTGPNIFQPTNILCSSTPMRTKTSRQMTSRVSDITLDPTESPIKGHGVRRKTVAKSSAKAPSTKPSRSVASRLSVVRHVAPTMPVTSASTALHGAEAHSTSRTDSDHTDSDSCNVTEPQRHLKNKINARNIPTANSQDTDNDFPTTDFNNEEELNDLNRTGEKSAGKDSKMLGDTSSAPAAVMVSGIHLSTSGHPLPVIGNGATQGQQKTNQASGSHTSSVPILRQKVYRDSPREPASSSATVRVGDETSVPTSGPKLSDSSPQHHVGTPRPTESLGSFEDDLLFDGPNRQQHDIPQRKFSAGEGHSRNNSAGDINSQMVVPSPRGNGPLKLPQDPNTNTFIPAALTAISSDLTTFSQRSPGRMGRARYQEPSTSNIPTPPFPLALVNPTESRPKIPRTPPPTTVAPPFSGASAALSGMSGSGFTASYFPGDNPVDRLNQYVQESQHFSQGQNSDHRNSDRKISPLVEHQNPRLSPITKVDQVLSSPGLEADHHRFSPVTREILENNDERTNSDGGMLSTNNWYNTPADMDAHIGASVQRSAVFSKFSENFGSHTNKNQNHFSNNNAAEKPFEDETRVKGVDNDLSEFMQIRRRTPVDEQHSASSRQDVASRLKSVFFRTESLNDHSHQGDMVSKPSDTRSVHSDSGLAVSPSTDNTTKHNSDSVGQVFRDYSDRENRLSQPKDAWLGGQVDAQHQHIPAILDPGNKDGFTSSRIDRQNSHNSRTSSTGSPVNGKSGNAAITTEKLSKGSAFSPIHPQPVTSDRLIKITVSAVSKDVVQPKPVTLSTDATSRRHDRTNSTDSESSSHDPRQRLISAHEDQLAAVTSLCKLEMKLLLSAKAGTKRFDEYVEKVSHVLSQKMEAIQLLQEHLTSYTNNQATRHKDF